MAALAPGWQVRPGRLEDAPHLPEVERSSGELFRTIPDLAWIAEDGVTSAEDHLEAIEAGAHWVAEGPDGALAGFLAAWPVEGALHIDELAVAGFAQGRGLGRALMAAAESDARRRGLPALTLTTFSNVPWNAPWYVRLGFEILEGAAQTPSLAKILAGEAERGLPDRCAMRKVVG